MKKITLLFFISIGYFSFANNTVDLVVSNYMPDLVIEAESGTLNRGASIQECALCSGGQHVGDIGNTTAPNGYLASVVTVATAGTYTMNLSASSAVTRSIFVSVNGGTGTEIIVNSGDWTTPAIYDLVITLAVGTNTIKFYNDISFAPNIDKFDLTLLMAEPPCTDCFGPFEAENGTIIFPATVQSCSTCSGGQHVGDMGFSDRYFTYAVTVGTAGTYKVFISYISGDPRDISVTVNEAATVSSTVHSIDWDVVFVEEMQIVLSAGMNTLKFHNPGNWAPNIDKFSLELAATLNVDNKDFVNFKIYPNPTNHSWQIKNQTNKIINVTLFDVLGKNVLSVFPNSNDLTIDGSTLKDGLYFAKIKTENSSYSIKLIKH